ncbi:MAG: hypothetical protein RLZZ330_321 [Actinomycetota bacterium]|jgi:2-amino-4-hydroxy-6-hydroxymethyldihydropteridine diphosphokinase
MTKSVISVGSNLGDRKHNLDFAFAEISKLPKTEILIVSSIYETSPVGEIEQQDFLNLALVIDTELSPLELLNQLNRIENEAGRVRNEKWGPRTLDLDIIDYAAYESKDLVLTIPHPQAANRRFVLEPLYEIDSNWKIAGQDLKSLLSNVQDQKLNLWQSSTL